MPFTDKWTELEIINVKGSKQSSERKKVAYFFLYVDPVIKRYTHNTYRITYTYIFIEYVYNHGTI
jgi:hypothetical protein